MYSKPTWNKNAVATSLGWVDSKTGEVLVSIRGLDKIVNDVKAEPVTPVETKVETPVEVKPEAPVVTETKTETKSTKKNK